MRLDYHRTVKMEIETLSLLLIRLFVCLLLRLRLIPNSCAFDSFVWIARKRNRELARQQISPCKRRHTGTPHSVYQFV